MWTIAKIKKEWLRNHDLGVNDSEMEEAFESCESLLGETWVQERQPEEIPRGVPFGELRKDGRSLGPIGYIAPTLQIFHIGRCLSSLVNVSNSTKLISGVASGDPSAMAEIEAIYLLKGKTDRQVELYPKLIVDGSEKEPDFRIRSKDGEWIYVEVSRADESDKHKLAQQLASSICQHVSSLNKRAQITLWINREFTDKEELGKGEARICEFVFECSKKGLRGYTKLPEDLGVLLISQTLQAPELGISGSNNVDSCPRVCASQTATTGQQVVVRVQAFDSRATKLLKREAAQLSRNERGMVMINIEKTTAGFKHWRPAIVKKLARDHSRVGGVCLFQGAIVLESNGANSVLEANYIINSRALLPLPAWIGTDDALE